jgi:AGCS family alanine or glycine:cation symporter
MDTPTWFNTVLENINAWVWGVPMVVLLFCTHLFFTVYLKAWPQRKLFKGIQLSLKRSTSPEKPGEISSFAALTTALAATIGTGNIVGVCTAVAMGGPGAVFWMWLTGVFGIATKYAEALLAVEYRTVQPNGHTAGGAMYVLERALGYKTLARIFAVCTAIAALGIGNMVQANSLSHLLHEHLHWPTALTGGVMAFAVGCVLLGGIKSLARTCEALVPVMAVGYVAGCLFLLFYNMQQLPHTIMLIWHSAFNGHAAVGGFAGAQIKSAMRYGIARGLFSNESGLGSAPIVAAAAQTSNPVEQALVASTATFWDTVVVCLLTGLAVVSSGVWTTGISGAALAHQSFAHLGPMGSWILLFALSTFVFSTLLGWSYYGEKALEYLCGNKSIAPYRVLWVVLVWVGACAQINTVWTLADIANACMALPNLVALWALRKKIHSLTLSPPST